MKKVKPKNKADTKKTVVSVSDIKKIGVLVLVIAALAVIALAITKPSLPAEKASNTCGGGTCSTNAEETSNTPPVVSDSKSAQPISTPDKTALIKGDQQVSAVEDVIAQPEAFVGSSMGVKGTVVATYPNKTMFTMGCSCRKIPVEYTGQMPAKGSTITAYGKVMKQDVGGYVFKADSIK